MERLEREVLAVLDLLRKERGGGELAAASELGVFTDFLAPGNIRHGRRPKLLT